jgi:uncharacterized protein
VHISLEQVRVGPVRWEDTLELDTDAVRAPELLELGPVRCRGVATFVDPAFHLHTELAYGQTLRCDRCLEPFEQPVELSVDLVLEQTGEEAGARNARAAAPFAGTHEPHEVEPGVGEEVVLEEDDLGVVRIAGDEVALAPLIAEQVVLNLPMKPLCRPDCAGLCPSCGADRNTERCDCRPSGDARFAGLAALLEREPPARS